MVPQHMLLKGFEWILQHMFRCEIRKHSIIYGWKKRLIWSYEKYYWGLTGYCSSFYKNKDKSTFSFFLIMYKINLSGKSQSFVWHVDQSLAFMILHVLCFQRQSFFTFILRNHYIKVNDNFHSLQSKYVFKFHLIVSYVDSMNEMSNHIFYEKLENILRVNKTVDGKGVIFFSFSF